MKLSIAALLVTSVAAFAPSTVEVRPFYVSFCLVTSNACACFLVSRHYAVCTFNL
jgi:hypothetical protein